MNCVCNSNAVTLTHKHQILQCNPRTFFAHFARPRPHRLSMANFVYVLASNIYKQAYYFYTHPVSNSMWINKSRAAFLFFIISPNWKSKMKNNSYLLHWVKWKKMTWIVYLYGNIYLILLMILRLCCEFTERKSKKNIEGSQCPNKRMKKVKCEKKATKINCLFEQPDSWNKK